MDTNGDALNAKPWWQHNLALGVLGVILSWVTYFLVPGSEYPEAPLMAAIVVLMAVWWILEVVPIAVTSLLPIFLFPVFNISEVAEVGKFYGRPIILLSSKSNYSRRMLGRKEF